MSCLLVWLDVAGQERDGIQQSNERNEWGVSGVRVELYDDTGNYVDYRVTGPNSSGQPGYYLFTNVDAGSYQLRFYPPVGHIGTIPNAGADDKVDSDGSPADTDPTYGAYWTSEIFDVSDTTVDPTNRQLTRDFGLWREVDYGDANYDVAANDLYPVAANLLTNPADAARHIIESNFYLGSSVDGELDGQPGTRAWGDDQNGDDDENGVAFSAYADTLSLPIAVFAVGDAGSVTVTGTKPITVANAYLQGWIDFNGDGDWDDAGEQIISNQALSGGMTFNFSIAGSAVVGTTYARFRYSSELDLTPRGTAIDGEVEDYAVQIIGDPVKSVATTSESHSTGSDVTIGEIVRYRLAVPVPEGVMRSVVITDHLPAELQVLHDGTITVGFISNDGITTTASILDGVPNVRIVGSAVTTPTAILPSDLLTGMPFTSGIDPIFNLGDLSNLDDDANAEYVVIEFNALVLNSIANQTGQMRSNDFDISFVGYLAQSNSVPVAVREPKLQVDKTVLTSPTSSLGPGSTVTYTLVVNHAAGSNLNAFDAVITDSLPTQLVNWQVVGVTASGVAAPDSSLVGNLLRVPATGGFSVTMSGRVTVTLVAQIGANVVPNQQLINTAFLSWTSLPLTGTTSNSTGSLIPSDSGMPTGERDGSGGAINDYQSNDAATLTVAGDWGDLPNGFATLNANNGPRHLLLGVANPYLGNSVDAEVDGQPSLTAVGDDSSGSDDEDGVLFLTPFTPGSTAVIQVTTGRAGYLSAFMDFDGNGTLDTVQVNAVGTVSGGGIATIPGSNLVGDMFFDNAGTYTLTLSVPVTTTGNIPSRFRFTQHAGEGGNSRTGLAASGEIEDYVLFTVGNRVWFDQGSGTPVNNFNGTLNTGEVGVAEVIVNLVLNGTNTIIATTTTDSTGLYRFHGVPAGTYNVLIAASNFTAIGPLAGYVSTFTLEPFVNADGDGNDNGVDDANLLTNGIRSTILTLSAGSEPTTDGDTSNIFDSNSNLSVDFGFVRIDYGDAPDTYVTQGSTSARHIMDPTFRLGATIDNELDGQPTVTAMGDDSGGIDDEDGVTFEDSIGTTQEPIGILVRGQATTLTIAVTKPDSINNPYLQLFVDLNGDGDFVDGGEQLLPNSVINVSGTKDITIPGTGYTGPSYLRVRFGSQFGTTSAGTAVDGEVEDYRIQIVAQPAKTLQATSEAHSLTNNVAVGEIVRYRVAVQVPEGVMSSFTITDNLATNLQFLNDGTTRVGFISTGMMTTTASVVNGLSGLHTVGNAVVAPTAVLPVSQISGATFAAGTDPVFRLGDITNPDNDIDAEYVVIEFNVLVLNIATNLAGTVISNHADASFGRFLERSITTSATVREPIVVMDKQLLTLPANVGPGTTVQYNLVISNTAANTLNAFNLVITDALPSTLINGRILSVSGTAGVAPGITGTVSSGVVRVPGTGTFDLPANGVLTVRIAAEVGNVVGVNDLIVNSAAVVWTSLPVTGTLSNGTGSFTPTGSGTTTGERDGSGGAINRYRSTDSVSFSVGGDWGDLPNIYNTLAISNGARHRLIAGVNPYLGVSVDSESNGIPNVTATGDDLSGTDDEDGVVFLAPFTPSGTTRIRVTTSRSGYLSGFIDFDNNGSLDQVTVNAVQGEAGLNATMPGDNSWRDVSLSGAGVYTFTIQVPSSATGNMAARFRITQNAAEGGNSASGEALNGEVEDYVLLSLGNELWIDVGSGTAANNYNGLRDSGEPNVAAGITLTLVLSGTNTPLATTTTNASGRYEFVGLTPGNYQVVVDAATFQTGGKLAGTISTFTAEVNANLNGDSNDNGRDHSVDSTIPAVNGIRSGGITLSLGQEPTTDGDTSNAFDSSSNFTLDMGFVRMDWGDAPSTYATMLANTGARHVIITGSNLGDTIDPEIDGQPTATASGDDNTDFDDEDGVQFGRLVIGRSTSLTVTATGSGFLNLWIDYNGNSTFDSGERIGTADAAIVGGTPLAITFAVPAGAVESAIARIRYTTGSSQATTATGVARTGEVEDYQVRIFKADYGDLPNTYGTLQAANGAYHTMLTAFRLGSQIDDELEGVPGVTALGDDSAKTPDDEDGVAFPSAFMPNSTVVVTLTAIVPAGTNASYGLFFDFTGDGDFADTNESYSGAATNGINTVTVNVPATVAASLYARVRLGENLAEVRNATGFASGGEVEDYTFLSLGNLVWFDSRTSVNALNYNGLYEAAETPIANVALSLIISGTNTTIATTTTDSNGLYQFSGLQPGQYTVRVNAANFLIGAPLDDWASTLTTEAIANNNIDDNDNGIDNTAPDVNGIRSSGITLGLGQEPGSSNVNNTLDFGFVALDLGDLPAAYGTLMANSGAVHVRTLVTTDRLGASVDSEADGVPTTQANGDDNAGIDDEDGVEFSRLLLGQNATITMTAGAAGYLNAWLDFNGNGAFESGERIVTQDQAVSTGSNTFTFAVPATVTTNVYGRFRYSPATNQGINPTGVARGGEVEDYLVQSWQADFGDLPSSYATLYASNGAYHLRQNGLYLGNAVDFETNGQPNAVADGDDILTTDDEDGVNFPQAFMPNSTVTVALNVKMPAAPSASYGFFIDFNGDGDFNDTNEAYSGTAISGTLAVTVNVPSQVSATLYARVRLAPTLDEAKKATGFASGGEVEDYAFLSLGNQLWIDDGNGNPALAYNGLFDNGETTAPAGTALTLLISGTQTSVATSTTDANGRYRFTGLQAGNFQVRVDAANFQTGGP